MTSLTGLKRGIRKEFKYGADAKLHSKVQNARSKVALIRHQPVVMAGTGTAPGKAFFHSNLIFCDPISYHFILIFIRFFH